MTRPLQDGLEWKETLFDLVPQWTQEPSIVAIENVCRQQLSIPAEELCNVSFHASGLFNKLYIVEHARDRLIMRVSLPVYPRHKTRAEWIFMELMEGTSAHLRWRSMTMEQKIMFTEQIATFQAELSGYGKPEQMFKGIGSLELKDVDQRNDAEDLHTVTPGLLVSHEFFMGNHLHYDIPRGPFQSSHDWLNPVLDTVILHKTGVLDSAEDEDDREDAEEILRVARKLRSLVPKAFPSVLDEPEITGLYHHDLHLKNILVDECGEITAVLDWECVSALPLWMTTNVPKFLDEAVREEEPQRHRPADESREETAAAAANPDDTGSLDDEGEDELYWEHRMEYEATQLRKVYEARLAQLWPEWPLEGSHAKIEFFQAVSQCDGIWVKKSGRWADRMEKGETIRFEDA
ncbi:phosphotransferase enzyme family-domain-containing protein [Coniochaeta sp. 2T2.1]|nr:phosphotransferase enzyme family-domain-containing protein [Coniochaeta sp. 2T2.1]